MYGFIGFIKIYHVKILDRLKRDRLLKAVVVSEGIAIFIMIVFPPFYIEFSPGIKTSEGFSFIMNPPVIMDSFRGSIYWEILLLEILAIISLGLIYWILFKR
jgi:hypothetical protein